MTEYIITEELRDLIMYRLLNEGYSDLLRRLKRETDDNPYNPQAEREKLLDELGKELNSRIAKMEILDSKNPSPLRKGIIMAYRDIEDWERLQRKKDGKG